MTAVRVPDVLLRISPKMLDRYQSLCVAGAGRGRVVPLPYTFARADASTCATYIDRDGLVRKAAANVPRIEVVDLDGDGVRETPGLLLEGSRQNLLLRSEEIDNAAWSKTTVTFGANADVAPDGATTADRLIEGALSQEHVVWQTPSATADVRHAFSVFAKAGSRSWVRLTIRDVNSPTGMVQAWFNLATGVLGTVQSTGVGSGAQAFIEKVGNGWYRCKLIGACNAGDTTPLATVGPTTGDTVQIYTGDGTSYISVWGAQFENNTPIPSSYIPTTTVAVTRAADSLTVPFNFGPMDVTVLARVARPVHADAAGTLGVFPGLYDIGNGVTGFCRAYFDSTTRVLVADLGNGTPTAAIPAGAELKLCGQYKNLLTGGQARLDVGSGFGAFGTAVAGFSAFGSQVVRVGGVIGGTGPLFGVLLDLIIARGAFTRDELLAIP